MRTAIVADAFKATEETGYGGSVYLSGLVERLQASGVVVRVYAREAGDGELVTGVGPEYRSDDYLGRLRFSSELSRCEVDWHQFDVVHSTSAASIPFLGRLRRSGVASFFDCRNSLVQTTKPLAAFQLATLALWRPTAVSFCDHRSLRTYERLYRRRASYSSVPVAVGPLPDRDWARPAETVLFAGELTKLKGFPDVLAAMRQLWLQGSELQLHVAGAGPLAGSAAALRDRWPDRLHLHGLVPRPAVDGLLRRADMLILPSRTEGISRVALEAAAAGLPVIATGVGGMTELAAVGAIVEMPVGRPGALARSIAELASDGARRSQLAHSAYAYVAANHTWDAAIQRLLSLYETLGRPPV